MLNAWKVTLVVGLALAAVASRADERAEQLKRDGARLERIQRVAILPVVIQVRMDREDKLPDPNRVAARVTAQMRLAGMLGTSMKAKRFAVVEPEAAALALKEAKLEPTDLYVVKARGGWDSAAETYTNKKKDECLLTGKWEDLRQAQGEMSLFRYRWHDLPDVVVGLASSGLGTFAKPDVEKARAIGARLGVDGLLYVQVADMETHEGSSGLLGERFKSTRIHLHATLVAADDGAVLWQARAKGTSSQKAGFFTGNSAFKGEDRKVIEGAQQAIDLLLADLYEGKGQTAR